MNKTLLINRVNVNKFKEDRKKIFFLIGDIDKKKIEDLLINTLNKIDFLIKKDIIYKYKGVQILMKEEDIPKVNKLLMDAGIEVYSIYELYDPME